MAVDWFVGLGSVGMAGAIFYPPVARFGPIAKVEGGAIGCHGFHGEDAFAWSVVSLGLYFWLNDLTGWTGKPSLRGCNAVGWPYGR